MEEKVIGKKSQYHKLFIFKLNFSSFTLHSKHTPGFHTDGGPGIPPPEF